MAVVFVFMFRFAAGLGARFLRRPRREDGTASADVETLLSSTRLFKSLAKISGDIRGLFEKYIEKHYNLFNRIHLPSHIFLSIVFPLLEVYAFKNSL